MSFDNTQFENLGIELIKSINEVHQYAIKYPEYQQNTSAHMNCLTQASAVVILIHNLFLQMDALNRTISEFKKDEAPVETVAEPAA